MTTKNHWGIWLDSETPTTGVYSIHDIAWEWINDEICLDCEEAYAQIEAEQDQHLDDDDWDAQSEIDYVECDSSHTKLIGGWIKGGDGKYDVDKDADDFAAIIREFTVQVIWSKTTERRGLCSPCYPGQCDMNSEGEFLCYTLPKELLRED